MRRRPITPIIALLFMGLCLVHLGKAYNLSGDRWPSNQQILMYLQLGSNSGTLIDGSASWNKSAEDGLARWNQLLRSGVQFAFLATDISKVNGDDKNSVFWSTNDYGDAWGPDVLAVTHIWTSGSTRTECDVVFNVNKSWNSYRGPLRTAAGGGTLHDFHRVAIHEFGHVLGLDHPDDIGQNVQAVMNSFESNTDAIQTDDAKGVQAIYGTIPNETISTPVAPSGPSSGSVGLLSQFSSGGASSNLGHPLQYSFD